MLARLSCSLLEPAGADSWDFCLQKWSKGKMKVKVNNAVLFDKVSSWCPAMAAAALMLAVGTSGARIARQTSGVHEMFRDR